MAPLSGVARTCLAVVLLSGVCVDSKSPEVVAVAAAAGVDRLLCVSGPCCMCDAHNIVIISFMCYIEAFIYINICTIDSLCNCINEIT